MAKITFPSIWHVKSRGRACYRQRLPPIDLSDIAKHFAEKMRVS